MSDVDPQIENFLDRLERLRTTDDLCSSAAARDKEGWRRVSTLSRSLRSLGDHGVEKVLVGHAESNAHR